MKLMNSGYWNNERPTVADEVQSGKMSPKWDAFGWLIGILAGCRFQKGFTRTVVIY